MKIIDAFCGLGPYWGGDRMQPLEAAQVLEVMDYCGIDSAVVYSNLVHTPASVGDANQLAAEAAGQCSRFLPMFLLTTHALDHMPTPADYARQMRQAGARAAMLRPTSVPYGLCTWVLGELLEMCAQARLPLYLSVLGPRVEEVDSLCRQFPRLRLVLTHVDYNADSWLYPLLRRHREVRVCLAPYYIPPLGVERFVRHFGPQRLIFGSGLPQFAPGGLLALVTYADLGDSDKAMILGGNMESLMREVAL
jgi:predicted TIM-barrel fold metal-dependent hydrolase